MATLVLALNPSIDVEWRVDQVQWEEKNTIRSERRWAGGKGVNVARWLRYLEGTPRLLVPLGGPIGAELARHLRDERLAATVVSLRQSSRSNVIVTTDEGGQLRFNPRGPKLSLTEWLAILEKVEYWLGRVSCVVLSGSLPQGLASTAYALIIRRAHRAGVKTVLDCDGESLRAAVKARPFLVKPNEHELAQWAGRSLRTDGSLFRAANALSAETRGWVLVSRGARGGLLVNRQLRAKFQARAPAAAVINTIGAGDAMVAAVVRQIELGTSPETWLHRGLAAGTAATQCAPGGLPGLGLVRSLVGKQLKARVRTL